MALMFGVHTDVRISDVLLGDLKTFREAEAFTETKTGRAATARRYVQARTELKLCYLPMYHACRVC